MKKVYTKPEIASSGALNVVASMACSNGDRSHCLRS